MRWPGFIGSSFQSQSLTADAEDTINFYVESVNAEGAANAKALYPTPGFAAFADLPEPICRGAVNAGGRVFVVFYSGLYEVYSDGTYTLRGTVTPDTNPATLNYNGAIGGQLFITSGTNGYCYDLATNTLTLVLTGEALMGAYVGGFFLALNGTTGKVRLSDLNDALTWDPGQFFQRSLFPDRWQAMFVDSNNLVWLPGTDTFEVWYNTGAGTQPFAPMSGLVGRFGIAAPFAWTLAGVGILWLARNADGSGVVVMTAGGIPQKVSSYPVDNALSTIARTGTLADVEALCYQSEGHTFAVFSFPSVYQTWAFDVDLGSWCKRGKWDSAAMRYDLWAPRCHVYAWGKHLTGDRTSGTLAWMDASLSTEIDGAGIRRLRRSPGFTREHARLPYDRIELLMDVGVGNAVDPGSDPQVMLRMSYDGGRTYGSERLAGMGHIGETRRRVYWNRFGVAPHAVVEVTVSDPVPVRIVDAYINPQMSEAA